MHKAEVRSTLVAALLCSNARVDREEEHACGDAEVRVANRLDVRISGSGDVFYKGQPEINDIITGSGDVIDAN